MKKLAVIGATSIAGIEFLSILSEQKIKIDEIVILSANEEEIGKEVSYGFYERLIVKSLQNYDFNGTDVAIFITDSGISEIYGKKAKENGCFVIDSSSYYRNKNDIHLIVPEINGDLLKQCKNLDTIISIPSASALQLATILKPLSTLSKIKRVIVSTYQAVSGEGQDAMDELFEQTKKIYENDFMKPVHFTKQMPFNLIPQVGLFSENDNYDEENYIINETNKILDMDIKISATCVRVPVFACYSQSINIEFDANVEIDDIKDALSDADSILILDKPSEYVFATPRECAGQDEIYISRIRKDPSVQNGINLWSVMDNIRKGKAINLVNTLRLVNDNLFANK